MKFMRSIPWFVIGVLCLTIGLAPFSPEPHVWEKLKMLQSGDLKQVVDWLDFAMHGSPWVLLILKLLSGKKS